MKLTGSFQFKVNRSNIQLDMYSHVNLLDLDEDCKLDIDLDLA